MLFRARERLLHQRTELVNALRSVLYEYGHIIPKGIAHIKRIESILEEPNSDLPALVREECFDLLEQIAEKTARIDVKTAKAKALSLDCVGDQRLCSADGELQTRARLCGLAWARATSIHLRRQGATWTGIEGWPDRYPVFVDHRCYVTPDSAGPQIHRRGIMAGTNAASQAAHAGGDRACEQDGAGNLGDDDKERGLSKSGASCGCMTDMHHHTNWRR